MHTIALLFLKRLEETSIRCSTTNQVSVHNCINGNLATQLFETPRNQAITFLLHN